jgi:predicted DNA-binding transcriptional regulator AlpA
MNTLAFSINEFCELYGFSRSYFYKLKEQGKAPKTYNLGKKVFISKESAEEWQRQVAG